MCLLNKCDWVLCIAMDVCSLCCVITAFFLYTLFLLTCLRRICLVAYAGSGNWMDILRDLVHSLLPVILLVEIPFYATAQSSCREGFIFNCIFVKS